MSNKEIKRGLSPVIPLLFTPVIHLLFSSGFDATVWRGNANSEFAGKTYVSLNGTDPFFTSDVFVADLNLTVSGAAREQIVDMVNWWLKNTTAVGGPDAVNDSDWSLTA